MHITTYNIHSSNQSTFGKRGKRNPQNTFQIYKKSFWIRHYLRIKMFGVLLAVAYDYGDFEAWDRYRAPQVAIREFQRHVKTTKPE